MAEGGFRHPSIVWIQRGVSLLLLGAAMERIINHFMQHRPIASPMLLSTFFVYWLASVAVPAMLGSFPFLSHEFSYALAIGLAATLVTGIERDKILDASRSALFAFLLISVLLVPFAPGLVMEVDYAQGFIPGLPRLAGLAPHPVALGMLAQIALLLLWHRPFANRWVNRSVWLLGLGVLVVAQSKTAWIAFLVCSLCMLVARRGGSFWDRLGNPAHRSFGIMVCLGFIGAVLALLAGVVIGDFQSEIAGFFDSAEGAQLLSLTGRDRIWAIAFEEWRANPLFGHGPGLWNEEFRASIGMPNATHAHNQFIDTLARSGSVGAAALVVYATVLLFLSLRYVKATGGLSLALFFALAFRSVSEVPLLLLGYGTELFAHLLLLVTLAAAAAAGRPVVLMPASTAYRVAS